MPADAQSPFIHRQTLASATRYSTLELSELERKILSAADKALALELEIFARLCDQIRGCAEALAETARALAKIDLSAGLATLAVAEGWSRPRLEASTRVDRKGVVEEERVV